MLCAVPYGSESKIPGRSERRSEPAGLGEQIECGAGPFHVSLLVQGEGVDVVGADVADHHRGVVRIEAHPAPPGGAGKILQIGDALCLAPETGMRNTAVSSLFKTK